jgi:uncharacterized ion transporter superfamily protein YfcC
MPRRSSLPHPVIVMLIVILAAGVLTWLVPSGAYQRQGKGLVVPGTYASVAKVYSLAGIFIGQTTHREQTSAGATPAASAAAKERVTQPAGIVTMLAAIPAGMIRVAGLISMIFFIGGMFGVLKATGALTIGLERLLVWCRGNIYLLAPVLMITISAGSTFLGLISEYLLIIPLVLLVGERLRISNLHAFAIVAIPAKIGYIASVTNPLPLVIAQPMLGLPVFSGVGLRLGCWVVLLVLGIGFLLWHIRRAGFEPPRFDDDGGRMSAQQKLVLLATGIATAILCYGASALGWGNAELGAFYIAMSIVLALVAGLDGRVAAESFLDGMKGMMLAGLLVGLAAAVDEILRGSLVLDTIIDWMARQAEGHSPAVVSNLMMGIEMLLGVLIPSISGKAAVSMPILGPIAQLAGVGAQTTVLAFLFGSGITNMISPTSGMLLAYLATGKTDFLAWARFVMPLVAAIVAVAIVFNILAVAIGY